MNPVYIFVGINGNDPYVFGADGKNIDDPEILVDAYPFFLDMYGKTEDEFDKLVVLKAERTGEGHLDFGKPVLSYTARTVETEFKVFPVTSEDAEWCQPALSKLNNKANLDLPQEDETWRYEE